MSLLKYTNEQAKEIVSNSSLNGWYSMYAFSLSVEKNIAFDRVDFSKKTDTVSAEYFYGYLVACYSLNIIKFNVKDNILTPIYFDGEVKLKLKEALLKMAEKENKVKEDMDKIEKYFL